jgi:hypothetical protein
MHARRARMDRSVVDVGGGPWGPAVVVVSACGVQQYKAVSNGVL